MILTDTGPLVALIDPNDVHYVRALRVLDSTTESLLTPVACFTEAMHLVHRAGGHKFQHELWMLRASGIVTLYEHEPVQYDEMMELMSRYVDIPMDFADAAVIAAASALGQNRIFTFDKHFHAYRLKDGSACEVIP